jgi:MATE family multidrug resistance protein
MLISLNYFSVRLLGVGGGWLLAFPLGMGVHGLWWGMAVGLTVTGSLLAIRFVALTSRVAARGKGFAV